MSKVTTDDSNFLSIADAIRRKLGVPTTYKPSEMATAIDNINTGVVPTGTISIIHNGTIDVTQYADAVVDVPNSYSASDEGKVVSNGVLTAQGSQLITTNGTYDTTLKNEVVVDVSGGGSGDLDLVIASYVEFNGNTNQVIVLPFTVNSDYTVEVDLQATSTSDNNAMVGTSGDYTQPHITIYSRKWYVSTGGNDLNFTKSITGRHTIILNQNNSVLFDGVPVLTNLTSSSSSARYWIGGRGDASTNRAIGRIYGYKITSISTGNVIANLKPSYITYKNNIVLKGFLDIENDVFYGNMYISGVGDL